MFYQESLDFTLYEKQPKIVEEFDSLLAHLTREMLDKITVSFVCDSIGASYDVVKYILEYYSKKQILKKQYEIRCPECGIPLERISIDEAYARLPEKYRCYCCNEGVVVSVDNIYVSYARIKEPTASKEEIEKTVKKEIQDIDVTRDNFFTDADLLICNAKDLYQLYYSPNESAYIKMEKLKDALDFDYKTTKEKGDAYEDLVMELIKQIRYASGTKVIKTHTNQIDCTVRYNNKIPNYPSVIDILSPYFLIECKNEAKTPSNTYFHKLSNIMSSNEAQLGIVFSRKKPSDEDLDIAREQYLLNRDKKIGRYLLSISDEDLERIIDDRINLLDYIDFKILKLTMGSPKAEYYDFKDK